MKKPLPTELVMASIEAQADLMAFRRTMLAYLRTGSACEYRMAADLRDKLISSECMTRADMLKLSRELIDVIGREVVDNTFAALSPRVWKLFGEPQ